MYLSHSLSFVLPHLLRFLHVLRIQLKVSVRSQALKKISGWFFSLSPFFYAFLIPVTGIPSLVPGKRESILIRLNNDHATGVRILEVNVDANISDRVLALALNSTMGLSLRRWRQFCASWSVPQSCSR